MSSRILTSLLLASMLSACAPSVSDPVVQSTPSTDATSAVPEATSAPDGDAHTFTASVWADNWFAMYVDGDLVMEDSVPITTERSFNQETFTFTAAYPFTIAVEAKDFKETDSGLEYIGTDRQQMGDGGLIIQVTDDVTGEVVAVTSSAWSTLVVHRAPLDTSCERDADPDATCGFEVTESPAGWTDAGFDDADWAAATEWSEAAVSPKDGYDEVTWDPSATLVWGTDLEVDNTVLLRLTVDG